MGRFAWWRRQLLGRQRHLIDHGWIVAQLQVQLPAFRVRDGQHVTGKAVGHFYGMGEGCITGDRIDQEKIRPAEAAFLIRARGALEIVQLRQAYERSERLPVSGRAVVDYAKLEGSKG
jgi:hypothetical protein